MISADDLRAVHSDYLDYAAANGRRYLPFQAGSERPGEMRSRASQLFTCPVKTALKRQGISPSHPHLVNDYASRLRFRNGWDNEDVWSEAMTWQGRWPVKHQVELENPYLVGKCDSILVDEDQDILIDYKDTVVRVPSMNRKGQIAAYMMMAGITRGFLILQHIDSNDIWEVSRVKDSYYFLSEKGEHDHLGDDELMEEIQRQQMANAVKAQPELRAGECSVEPELKLLPKEMKRPKGYIKPGQLTVRCEYFGHCYGHLGDHYRTEQGADGEIYIVE